MGVVKRQSIKRTLVSFVGVLVGTVSILKIYPLEFEIYGRAQFIIATASLIIPFASLGIGRLTVRYFPDFQNSSTRHHGFLGFLLLSVTICFLIFICLFLLLEEPFIDLLEAVGLNSQKFLENRHVILIISVLLAFNSILGQFSSNFKRVVVPELFNNLFVKISLPALVLGYYLGMIGVLEFKYLYALTYGIVTLALVGYLIHLGEFSLRFDLKFVRKNKPREMLIYGVFNALSSIGYLLSFRIDSIMIGSLMDYDSVGYYNFYSYIVNTMAIPYMSIVAISSPLIAQNFKENDLLPIARIYKRSSEILLIASLLLICGVWVSLESLLKITGKFEILWHLRSSFLLLAAGQLINVTTGLNEPIIGYSKYYRFNLYAMIVLAALNVFLNITLIPKLGILGAAIATAISLITYNIVKCLYIYLRLRILPFSRVHVAVLLIAILAMSIMSFIPSFNNVYFDAIFRAGVFIMFFVGPLILFNVSSEVTSLYKDFLKGVRQLVGWK